MNRQRYQLVFNRHRGMLMAVAETASVISGQGMSIAGGIPSRVAGTSWRFAPLAFALALVWQNVTHAQILVDRNAPREQQPMVVKAANGVPVVNIQQPNAKGLSVNSYRRFDVDERGAILNNSGQTSKTELGGYVAGNPWVPRGGAQVIVNQVNSPDPSYLRGFIEVAGNRAQVIIANPSGITCAGCGFINAQRATMTTGRPVIGQGNLESYRVGSGMITFEGAGMDAGNTGYVDVIARAVRIHAALRAKQIKVTTGLNMVSADHAQVTPDVPASDVAPVRAIDVAQLGGMYAGHIYLSATEHGVGVHNGGTLAAFEGQLIVTAAGRLENTGMLAARGDTHVTAGGAVSNTGTMGSESALRVNAAALDNRGTITAPQSLQIRTGGTLINSGTLGGTAGTLLDVGGLENARAGSIGSAGSTILRSSGLVRNAGSIVGDAGITLDAAAMENTGSVITPATLTLRIREALDNSGKIGSNGLLSLQAGALVNRQDFYSAQSSVQLTVMGRVFNSGSIEAKKNLTAHAAMIENQGRFIGEEALTANAGDKFINAGTADSKGDVDLKSVSVENRGTVTAGKSLALNVSGNLKNEKSIDGASGIQLAADTMDNSGSITTPGGLTLRIGGAALNSGTIEAAQSLSLKAAALNNSGTLTAVSAIRLSLQQMLNNTGEIGANDSLSILASSLDNHGRLRSPKGAIDIATQGQSTNHGKIQAATKLELAATGIDNSDGTLSAEEIAINTRNQRFNNQRGAVFARQDLKLGSGAIDNAAGSLAAKGNLTISSGEINNQGGLLQAIKSVEIDTHDQSLQNIQSGKDQGIRAGTSLRIKAGALSNRGGVMVAVGDASLTSHSLDNQGGDIATGGALTVDAGSLDNRRGLIRSDAEVTLQSNLLRNDDTQGQDQGIEARGVSITAASVHNNRGAIRTGQSLQITATSSVDNRGGLLSSQGSVGLTDPAAARRLVIDNEDGRIVAGEDLNLTSRSLIGKGLLVSHKDLRIDLTDGLEHRGETAAVGNLDLRTGGSFINFSTVAAGAGLRITARGIQNHAGASLLGRDVLLSAGTGQAFTNRGLIDGVTTRIQAGTLYNIGTGRIYGDRVALSADVLHNTPETVDGVTRAPVIATRERLDIGTGLLYNNEQALLYSVGDLSIGGTIGSDHRATGRAREVNNTSAAINADGAMTIAADTINNHNAHFETGEESKPRRRLIRYRLDGSPDFLSSDEAKIIHRDSGQIIAPENWRAMGDEDNFRLLLPSAKYPFDKFGAASDYKPAAYQKPEPETWTESGRVPEVPEEFFYTPEDPIWDRFGIARPAPLAPEPKKPLYWTFPEAKDVSEYWQEQYRTWLAWQAWKDARTAFVKSYIELDDALKAFRADYEARLRGQWTIYDGTEQIRRTIVTRSAPGMITSGGAMNLVAGVVNNYASQFIAGGALAGDGVNGTAINNTGPLGRQTVTSTGTAQRTYIKSHRFRADDRRYDSADYASQTIESQFPLDVSATHGAGNVRDNVPRTPASVAAQAVPSAGKTADLRAPAVDLSLPANALYQVNQSQSAAQLIQTDPRFIGNRNWLSSDFLLRAYQEQFGTAPGYKRFGDGFYEQQLIQRQIQEATGQRYLNGFTNNEAQYLALMQAGLQQAQVQRYALGISLSDAQIAQLKTDIVWLVRRTVTLADGSHEDVLVPQVYLQPSSVQVSGRQTLIAGNELAFQTVQDIINKGGTLSARSGVSLRADNIRNVGGRIQGGNVLLAAHTDIENSGGVIDANDGLVLRAGRDVLLRSTRANTANATTTGSNINQVVSVSGKDVVIAAGRDLRANAAVIAATGDATLAAGRDVSLGIVREYFRQEINWATDAGASNWVSRLTGPNFVDRANGAHGTKEVGVNRSVVTGSKEVTTQVSGNSIRIQAGQDVVSKGAQVVVEAALQVDAGRDIRIGTANASASARDQGQRSSSGILSAKTVRTDDASSTSHEVGSTFSGNTAVVRAGHDVNVIGSNIVSTQGTVVAAGNDVNLVAAIETSSQRNFRQETRSGVMGAGFGITVGSRTQSREVDGQRQTASASTIGSVEGDVRIVAGNRYTQLGSDVLAPAGDINIVAKTVSILAAQQRSNTVTEDKFRQQGVTVAVSSPVLSAVQNVQQMAEAASKTKDGRMQALAGAAAGLSVANAADAIKAGQGKTIDGRDNQIVTGPADPATGKTPTASEDS